MLAGLAGICGGLVTKRTPALKGAVQVSQQTSGTTFAPTIPTHVNGDVLVLVVAYKGTAALSASGWTATAQTINTNASAGMVMFTRLASAAPHTISIANSNNNNITAHVSVLQYASAAAEAGAAQSNDPPSLTTSWGADLNYWIAADMADGAAPSAGPTGFANSIQTSNSIALTTLDKADPLATLDPSAFTGGTNPLNHVSFTIAVRP